VTDQAPQSPAKSLALSIIIQFTHFSAAGAVGTLLHYAMLIRLVSGNGASPVTGTALGATAGAITNYWLNRHYTFLSNRAHREAFPRFILMACLAS
jgi:putative flippase GtrA